MIVSFWTKDICNTVKILKILKLYLGQGADFVLGLIEKCEVKAGSTITFDNLFTSLLLLDELTELGIGALGTLVRQKRFRGAPVANKTTLAKKPRGWIVLAGLHS